MRRQVVDSLWTTTMSMSMTTTMMGFLRGTARRPQPSFDCSLRNVETPRAWPFQFPEMIRGRVNVYYSYSRESILLQNNLWSASREKMLLGLPCHPRRRSLFCMVIIVNGFFVNLILWMILESDPSQTCAAEPS